MWIFNILKVYMWLTLSSIRESNIWFLKVELLIVSGNLQTVVLWPPHAKSWLIGKDSDAGTDWWQEEKGTTEDEMTGWHHWLDGSESEWTSGSWWWTGRPGMLRFMGSQRVRHDWATELNCYLFFKIYFLLSNNCFTLLYWFLPYINMYQP